MRCICCGKELNDNTPYYDKEGFYYCVKCYKKEQEKKEQEKK